MIAMICGAMWILGNVQWQEVDYRIQGNSLLRKSFIQLRLVSRRVRETATNPLTSSFRKLRTSKKTDAGPKMPARVVAEERFL